VASSGQLQKKVASRCPEEGNPSLQRRFHLDENPTEGEKESGRRGASKEMKSKLLDLPGTGPMATEKTSSTVRGRGEGIPLRGGKGLRKTCSRLENLLGMIESRVGNPAAGGSSSGDYQNSNQKRGRKRSASRGWASLWHRRRCSTGTIKSKNSMKGDHEGGKEEPLPTSETLKKKQVLELWGAELSGLGREGGRGAIAIRRPLGESARVLIRRNSIWLCQT